jgi:hypothetical protein
LVGTLVAVCVGVFVAVLVGVFVGVLVAVLVGVFVAVAVCAMPPSTVLVGVAVGEPPLVRVKVKPTGKPATVPCSVADEQSAVTVPVSTIVPYGAGRVSAACTVRSSATVPLTDIPDTASGDVMSRLPLRTPLVSNN